VNRGQWNKLCLQDDAYITKIKSAIDGEKKREKKGGKTREDFFGAQTTSPQWWVFALRHPRNHVGNMYT
jgi:hypothetical protein